MENKWENKWTGLNLLNILISVTIAYGLVYNKDFAYVPFLILWMVCFGMFCVIMIIKDANSSKEEDK